jgi:hypothetical protein
MDLSIPIVGLMAFVGYKLNDSKTPRNTLEQRNKISPSEKSSGTNVYTSTFSKEIQAKERKIADILNYKAKDPVNTNIIPELYNTYCTSTGGTPIEESSNQTILPQLQSVRNGSNGEPSLNNKIMQGPMFRDTYVSSNVESESVKGPVNYQENFSNIQNGISSLTGLPVELKHNNMVPFFGSNITQNTNVQGRSVLEDYTGATDTPQSKREVPKMFENAKQNIYGSRPDSDLIGQDRFYQSNLKTNLLPVPQIKVQPLPEEYVRPSFKSVDDLRIATKPKTENKGRVVQGKRYITNRGVQAPVVKNRPDTFYINNSSRYFVGPSAVKGQTVRENFKNNYNVKAQATEKTPQIGIAHSGDLTKGQSRVIRRSNVNNLPLNGEMYTIDSDDTRQSFMADWIRNAGNDVKLSNCIDRKSYTAYEQERETTSRMELLGAADKNRGYHQSMPEQAKTTNKESNLFSYTGNAVNEVDLPQDYTYAYNYTREKQYINNPDYKGNAGQATMSKYNTLQYDNLDIFTGREEIMDLKGYKAGGQMENTPLGAQGLNIRERDDTLRKSKYDGFNVNRVRADTANLFNIGEMTDYGNKDAAQTDLGSRIDPDLLSAYKNNPYTQNLHSY